MSIVQIASISKDDYQSLRQAVELLEFPTFADKLTSLIGRPIDKAMKAIPIKVQYKLASATHRAMEKAFDWVIQTVNLTKPPTKSRDTGHKLVAAGLGAVSGFAGGWVFLAELPLTTAILLRTIADIAHHEGEDLSTAEARLACIEVFALDTAAIPGDHAGTSTYFALRKTLATVVAEASAHIAQNLAQAAAIEAAKQAAATGAGTMAAQAGADFAAQAAAAGASVAGVVGAVDGVPVVVRLINEVSSRFGVTVSQEFAASLVPVIGAVGGAAVNYAFTVFGPPGTGLNPPRFDPSCVDQSCRAAGRNPSALAVESGGTSYRLQ